MDPAFNLVNQFSLYLRLPVTIHVAYAAVKYLFPFDFNTVNARCRLVGPPPFPVGFQFPYRYQLILGGMHWNPVHGVTIGQHNGRDVATCIIEKYARHNFDHTNFDGHPIPPGDLIYGGTGGSLAQANTRRKRRRVLHDHVWTAQNLALRASRRRMTPVRFVRTDRNGIYYYAGMYRVIDYWYALVQRTPPRPPHWVIEFQLTPYVD